VTETDTGSDDGGLATATVADDEISDRAES
jgi:hypothetical protein